MKRRIVLITPLLVIALLATVFFLGRRRATVEYPDMSERDLERLENMIIVQGIQPDVAPEDSEEEALNSDGRIIFDNEFEIQAPVQNRKDGKAVATSKTMPGPDAILADLKKSDARWHLIQYRIRRGDNLWSIARRHGANHRSIIQINRINSPEMLREGNQIHIPTRNGVSYIVKRGDTVKSIAAMHRVPPQKIAAQNNIHNARLKVGQSVFIPDAQRPAVQRQIVVARNQSNRNMIAPARKEAPRPEAPQPRAAPVPNDRIALDWPLQGSITSSFGTRTNPLTRERSFHTGIDIGVPIGTEVRAAEKGKVLFSGWKDSYGNMVIIRHERGYITVYAHNKKNLVSENDDVNRGDPVALSGMTGSVTGPHLHFELRKHLTPLNPRRFMR